MKTEVFVNRETQSAGWLWLGLFFVGVIVGVLAFIMELIEHGLVDTREAFTTAILANTDNNQFIAWIALIVFAFNLACLASVLTIYIGPGATGSGIAEIIAILNGVNIPGFISFNVLFVKCFCVVLAIVASLCIGKEGPLAHIGAIVS